MIVLIILAVIIFLLVLTLNIPVSAYIRYYDGKPDIKVSFLFAQLYPARPKKEKKKKLPKKQKKKEKSVSEENFSPKKQDSSSAPEAPTESGSETEKEEDKDIPQKAAAEKKEKKSDEEREKTPRQNPLEKLSALLDDLTEKKNAVQLLAELVIGPLKKLGGKLRIDDLKIDFAAADDDACNAALLYGKVNAAVYNALSAVRCFVPVSVTGIRIDCLFNTPAEKCRWDGEFKIKLRPASLVNALLAVAFGYIKDTKKYAPVMALFGKN